MPEADEEVEAVDAVDAVVVGGGPRAVAVVVRLAARRRPTAPYGAAADPDLPPLRVVLVDRVEVGAGSTWRTDQPAVLVANTTVASTTAHADATTPMTGPVVDGPDLLSWVAGGAAGPGTPPWARVEAAGLGPADFPTRRLQGAYYREQLREAATRGGIALVEVLGEAEDLRAPSPGVREVLVRTPAGRVRWRAPVVVLAQGMLPERPTTAAASTTAAAGAAGLVHLAPGLPTERDWSVVPEGGDALVLGLGAGFLDVVALLTLGRGGHFVDARTGRCADEQGRPHDDGGAGGPGAGAELVYVPSGREPHLLAGSRRGVPFRGKGALEPSAARYRPRLATPEVLDRLGRSAGGRPVLDFRADVWPLLERELVLAHLLAVAEQRPSAVAHRDEAALVALVGETHDPVGRAADLLPADEHLVDPRTADRPDRRRGEDWDAWVARWVHEEQGSVDAPATSPRARVSRAMAALRGPAVRLVAAGVVDGASVLRDVEGWFLPLALALASGPPPRRASQLLALVRAGVVDLVGPVEEVRVEDGGVLASAPAVGPVRAAALLETRVSRGAAAVADDRLVRGVLDEGRARLHRLPRADGGSEVTDSLDVTGRELLLVDARGEPDERVVVLGIPAEAVQRGSMIGATPGHPSPLLAGADVAAARVLACRRGARPEPGRPLVSAPRTPRRSAPAP